MQDNAPSYADICAALRDRAAEFAEHVLGEKPTQKLGNELRFFPKGGLRVFIKGPKKGKWTNFGEVAAYGDMVDLLRWRHGKSKKEAIDYAKSWLGLDSGVSIAALPKPDTAKLEEEQAALDAKRLKAANFLWNSSSTTIHPDIVKYLAGRGINVKLPACVRSRVIADKKILKDKMGIDGEALGIDQLVSATFVATNAQNEVRAVQQILLHNAKKAKVENPKRTNGLLPAAAVRLAEPGDTLILAEGPETGLSIWQATAIPTWIVLGTSNYTLVEIPPQVKVLIIALDLEAQGNGLAAALKAACFWQAKGLVVKLAFPGSAGETIDFNDVLQAAGEAAIRSKIDAAITSDGVRVTEEIVIARNPWDALAAWQATGAAVTATIRPMNPDLHVPEGFTKITFVVEPGETPPQPQELLKRVPNAEIRFVRPSALSLREIAAAAGPEAVRTMLRTATPMGRETLYGIERLALRGAGSVILCQSRASADAAHTASDSHACLAYNAGQTGGTYDWSPLTGRVLALAPVHSPLGVAQAAHAAAEAGAVGAADVRVIEWPLFAPGETGYVVKRRHLPKGYDLCAALEDGWTGTHLEELVRMAAAL